MQSEWGSDKKSEPISQFGDFYSYCSYLFPGDDEPMHFLQQVHL